MVVVMQKPDPPPVQTLVKQMTVAGANNRINRRHQTMLLRCAARRHARALRTTGIRSNATGASPRSQPAHGSTASSSAFESLIAAPATEEQVSLRVHEYFDNKDLNAVSPTLRQQIVHSAEFVQKLSPLLQWGFQNLMTQRDGKAAAKKESTNQQQQRDAVASIFVMLTPWTNIAKDKMWRKFYIRQFFLSHAPLDAFLAVFEIHQSVLPDKRHDHKDTAYLASDLVQEFCSRGRFDEALDAYAQLPLTDRARKDVVATIQDHEQFPSVIQLYKLHRTLEPQPAPLDPFPFLNALNILKRHEELHREFQKLSPQEQSRADIQQLVG